MVSSERHPVANLRGDDELDDLTPCQPKNLKFKFSL
jgi:hypothetical protein